GRPSLTAAGPIAVPRHQAADDGGDPPEDGAPLDRAPGLIEYLEREQRTEHAREAEQHEGAPPDADPRSEAGPPLAAPVLGIGANQPNDGDDRQRHREE